MTVLDGDSQTPSCKVSVRVCVVIARHVHDNAGVEAVGNERLGGRRLRTWPRGCAERRATDLRLPGSGYEA